MWHALGQLDGYHSDPLHPVTCLVVIRRLAISFHQFGVMVLPPRWRKPQSCVTTYKKAGIDMVKSKYLPYAFSYKSTTVSLDLFHQVERCSIPLRDVGLFRWWGPFERFGHSTSTTLYWRWSRLGVCFCVASVKIMFYHCWSLWLPGTYNLIAETVLCFTVVPLLAATSNIHMFQIECVLFSLQSVYVDNSSPFTPLQ